MGSDLKNKMHNQTSVPSRRIILGLRVPRTCNIKFILMYTCIYGPSIERSLDIIRGYLLTSDLIFPVRSWCAVLAHCVPESRDADPSSEPDMYEDCQSKGAQILSLYIKVRCPPARRYYSSS
jgi:hypothetical protein